MNIIEALKSRKPFRRKSISDSLTTASASYCQPLEGDLNNDYFKGVFYHFSVADILADDWEILEPIVSISRKEFWDAVDLARSRALPDEDDERLDILAYRVAKNLGLE